MFVKRSWSKRRTSAASTKGAANAIAIAARCAGPNRTKCGGIAPPFGDVLLHDDVALHAEHRVHEMRAGERIGAGMAGRPRDVDGASARDLDLLAVLELGLVGGR